MNRTPMALVALLLLPAYAQLSAGPQAAQVKVECRIVDQGKPVPQPTLAMVGVSNGQDFKVKGDRNGACLFPRVPAGEYRLQVLGPDGTPLLSVSRTLSPLPGHAALRVVLDLTRDRPAPAGLSLLAPQRVETIKAQDAKAVRLNGLIQQAQAALNAKRWNEAADPLKEMIELDRARWEFHQALGVARLNLGQYPEAVEAFEQGIAAHQADLVASTPGGDTARFRAEIAQMLVSAGNAYLKQRKPQPAVAAYRKAAEIDPNPALAYFNLCATLYNQGDMEAAAAACDHAIAADPSRADAYFIKGSALYGNGRLDAQNRYLVPAGTVEALRKYLELAPAGAHAGDVKAMLDALDTRIETTYEKRK